MTHPMLASVAASITELKRNPMATISAGDGGAVAISQPQSARVLLRSRQDF